MIGESVGAYLIESRLGEGGMGTVYLARHSVMGRRAAVKVLRPEQAARPEMVQRFFNEARAAAAIEHASIVDVYDVGTRDDGTAFLVMELLEGETLAARLKSKGALPVDTALRIARQIAGALAAAHGRGIVHRDLKPDNVFLVPDTETTAGERVKLLDFGIAKLHGDLAVDAPVTHTGAVFGTPVYMAPEQCRGAVEVDARADLYALGCILYEMLCGRPPFSARGLGDLLSKHMTEPPVPPRQITTRVPEDVESVVLRLLAKDPADRYQSASWLLAALGGGGGSSEAITKESLAVSSTVMASNTTLGGTAAEVTTPERPRRDGKKPWLAVGVGAAVIATAAVILVARGDGKRATSAPPPDPAAGEIGAGEAALDAAPAATPELGLAFIGDLETASGSALARYGDPGAWEAAARDFEIAATSGTAPARWRAAAKACAGWASLLHNDPAAAEPLLAEAVELDPTWPTPAIGLSAARVERGDRQGALDAAHEAQRRAPRWWLAVVTEARVYRRLVELDAAIETYRRALQLAPGEPVALAELALVYHAQHIDSEAERYAHDALAADPDMVAARLLLAERALERRDGKAALAEAERVVAIAPDSASGQLARADALRLLHRKEEARAAYQKVIDLEAETHQQSVSSQRLADITKALAAGRLPDPKASRSPRERTSKPGKMKIDERSHRQGGDDDVLPTPF